MLTAHGDSRASSSCSPKSIATCGKLGPSRFTHARFILLYVQVYRVSVLAPKSYEDFCSTNSRTLSYRTTETTLPASKNDPLFCTEVAALGGGKVVRVIGAVTESGLIVIMVAQEGVPDSAEFRVFDLSKDLPRPPPSGLTVSTLETVVPSSGGLNKGGVIPPSRTILGVLLVAITVPDVCLLLVKKWRKTV